VLAQITHGQRLDIERFPSDGHVRALATEADAEAYTQLVAGCVGEFWTRVCARHLPGFTATPLPRMEDLGRSFGRGLQRINILRDAGADLANGRCYFPVESLRGADPARLAEDPSPLLPLWQDWIARADAAMDDGLRYAQALSGARLRIACALPALIGLRTLSLLRAAGPRAVRERVKMPREEVRRLLWGAALSMGSERWMRDAAARVRDNRTP